MVVSVVVGLQKISVSSWEVFLMIDKSKKLTRLLDSSVGFSCKLECMELV
jgi:hypothetical protein